MCGGKFKFFAQDSDLAHFWEDLSQNEKLSEIKPPLEVSCKKEFDVLKVSLPYDLFIVFVMEPRQNNKNFRIQTLKSKISNFRDFRSTVCQKASQYYGNFDLFYNYFNHSQNRSPVKFKSCFVIG